MKAKKLNLVGRLFLSGLAFLGLSNLVKGSELSNFLDAGGGGIQNSSAELVHHSQPNLFNTDFIEGMNPAVDIFYDKNSVKKKKIGEPADSMETKTAYIAGRGLSGPTECTLDASIYEASFHGSYPENNMIGKKVIGNLYQRQDDGQGGYEYPHVKKFNVWNMHHSGQKIPITVSNGVGTFPDPDFFPSHYWTTSFSYNNECDFDDDGDVDNRDFGVLANEYKNGYSIPGNYLSDVNGPDGHSDGFVDWYDVSDFSDNWLQ